MFTSLDHILPGWTVRIVGINATGLMRKRLMEMGIVRGVTLRVLRMAPLGDPMEIQLRGLHISLRKREAARIDVERLEGPPARMRRRMRHRGGERS